MLLFRSALEALVLRTWMNQGSGAASSGAIGSWASKKEPSQRHPPLRDTNNAFHPKGFLCTHPENPFERPCFPTDMLEGYRHFATDEMVRQNQMKTPCGLEDVFMGHAFLPWAIPSNGHAEELAPSFRSLRASAPCPVRAIELRGELDLGHDFPQFPAS